MARAGLNKFNVQQARDTLLARGINPPVDAVRVELGNTGSKTTIHRYLKELKAEDATQLGDEALLSNALKDMVVRMAAKLRDEALQRAEAANHAWQNEKTQLVVQFSAAQDRLKDLGADNAALTSRLERESVTHDETKDRLHHAELRAGRCEQQVKGLEQQLDENQKHRASLEEKHRCAGRIRTLPHVLSGATATGTTAPRHPGPAAPGRVTQPQPNLDRQTKRTHPTQSGQCQPGRRSG